MIVTAPLFQAYLECPTKCWLRFHAESATGNVYAEWVRTQNDLYRLYALNRLRALFATREQATAPSISKQSKGATWQLATDVYLHVNGLDSHLQAVEKMPTAGGQRTVGLCPIISIFQMRLQRKKNFCSRSMRCCCRSYSNAG